MARHRLVTQYQKQLNQKQFKLKLSCTETKKEVQNVENHPLKELTQSLGGALDYNGQLI